ncbi:MULTISPECIES: J domain-containing protein [Klebsiella]|nr:MULTISPECIES: DnaJ domain-containing protein [Klebsiella]MDG9901298.1 DnaJ domain-containing protein [Klebsiella grimontii]MDH0815022.1 DnaJ domain-containing protein [Klebsiella grimontii]MDH2045114.1 DnaJ domain-containing protein [Klebsiella grimontii]
MRTHYDNLKVSKDAPVEVIQAAYRTLAKKYHPDINKNNPEAVRIMQIINASYEVLINPLKRKEHDR